ncbi:MAG: hypothetical protein KJ916_02855 [Alphaproteobacteria bacterium]|nr:hypothetical protein [Alphaproteobacteria bacterium]MBU1539157.1 hypothetical protein [Alphaproteobacteria bacterium]
MSGILIAALAGWLTPQAAPHPSTLTPYTAPVIRPFEPGSDFGREVAQGDGANTAHRRPLTAPVTVEAYVGSYEVTPTDIETAYEQGVASAEIRADQMAGPLDGAWRVVDAAGATLYDLVLMDAGFGPVEGGWREPGGPGVRRSGAALSDGRSLTLEGGGVITLERSGGGWTGRLTLDGQTRPVTLSRPD